MVVLAASNYDDKVDGKKDQTGSKQDIYWGLLNSTILRLQQIHTKLPKYSLSKEKFISIRSSEAANSKQFIITEGKIHHVW